MYLRLPQCTSLAYDELMSYFSDSFVLSLNFFDVYLVINAVLTCNSCEIVIFPASV